ncbi:phosphate-starvation-inducible PsiE family protein [Methanomethylovorans sp.]|uniref:phosphate-starvation-inducible PsiE family protein n=2 Tax=Methanomethylovorans sp. TaxID=2758717 RepID=UPI00351C4BC1
MRIILFTYGVELLMLEENMDKFEKVIIISLAIMMSLVVLFTTLELGLILVKDISPPTSHLTIDEVLDLFGLFLLVLIGIELLHTIRTYSLEHVIHAEVVLTVALIAIGRKVIILDIKTVSGITLIGIGSIIIALCVGYYYFKKGLLMRSSDKF